MKLNTSLRKLLLLGAACAFLGGCDMVDSQMLEQLHQYFPAAEVTHPDPTSLRIETHLSGLTEQFAEKVVAQLLREHCCHGGALQGLASQDLNQILPLAGYQRLIIGFEGSVCGWLPMRPQNFTCRDASQNSGHTYSINDQVALPMVQGFSSPLRTPIPVLPRR